MRSGESTDANRRRYRCASSVVLPEPAGAWTNTEPSEVIARSRAGASAAIRTASLMELVRLFKRRRHTAQALKLAALACLDGRRHLRPPGGELAGDPLDAPRPNLYELSESRHPFQFAPARSRENLAPLGLRDKTGFRRVHLGVGDRHQGLRRQQR